jgi:hypothetical protein
MNASAGNRAKVTSMATMYSTTRPLMLDTMSATPWQASVAQAFAFMVDSGFSTRGACQGQTSMDVCGTSQTIVAPLPSVTYPELSQIAAFLRSGPPR